jgi:putative polyhydroxyalkanoate system protein
LGKDAARREVEAIAADMKHQLQIGYSWTGDTLQFERAGADGTIDVSDNAVEVDLQLGILLSPMTGMIEEQINSILDSRLGPR